MNKVLLAVLVTVSFLVIVGLNQEVHAQEISLLSELVFPEFDVDIEGMADIVKIDLATGQQVGSAAANCSPGTVPEDDFIDIICNFSGYEAFLDTFDNQGIFIDVIKHTLFVNDFDIDSDGDLYLTDSRDYVVHSDAGGNFIGKWSGDPDPQTPGSYKGLAINSQNNLIITDSRNHQVKVFTRSGTLLNSWGSQGTDPGQFDFPFDVAVDSNDNVYVVDRGNDRIQKFDSDGNILASWGSFGIADGEFRDPGYIAYDVVKDRIWVSDFDNKRVQYFTADGQFVGKITDAFGPLDEPRGIAVSTSGFVVIAVNIDFNNDKLVIVSNEGVPITTFVSSVDLGDFGFAKKVVIDDINEVLYFGEAGRVLKFSFSVECDKTWVVGDGNWHVDGNWEPSGVPDGTEKICIDGNFATNSVVTLNSDFTLTTGSIEIGFRDKLIVGKDATLTDNSGNTIINSGTIENFGTISNTGVLNNKILGEIINKGLIVNSGTIITEGMAGFQSSTIKNEGIINNIPGGTINNMSPGHSGRNLAGIQNEGTINNSGIIINSGGVVSQNRIVNTGIDNSGTIINSNLFTTSGTFLNSGSIDNSVGTLNTDLGGVIANSGTIDNTSGNINNAGIFQNDCTGIVQGFQISVTENRFTGTLVELICRAFNLEIDDKGLDGKTFGVVVINDYIVKIEKLFDGPPQIRISAFPDPAMGPNQFPTQITKCGGARITFGQVGGITEFFCSTVTMRVIQGTVEVEFFTSGDPITTILNEGQAVTYDEQTLLITADPDNTQDIIIEINGEQIRISPGETIQLELTGPQPPDDPVIGGEIIPIESASLILAGAQSFSWMIPVILSGIGIGLFVVSRKN